MKERLTNSDKTTSFIKRGNKLVQDPNPNLKKKPYFNTFGTGDIGLKKESVCIPKKAKGVKRRREARRKEKEKKGSEKMKPMKDETVWLVSLHQCTENARSLG